MDRCRFKLLVLLALLAVQAAAGAAITTYDIDLDTGSNAAMVNASFELYADDRKINYWQTTWTLPDNAEVLNLSDSQGPIEEYTVNGNQLQFQTNTAPQPKEKEVVDVQLRVDDVVQDTFNGLHLVQLRLSGFEDRQADVPDEVTQATVTSEQRIRSESHTPGFNYQLNNHSVTYKGDGPLNLHLTTSDLGEEYENFVLYGNGDLTATDKMYGLAPAITGFAPQLNRHPVVVLPSDKYDREVDTWSSGQYRTGGLIFVRESVMPRDKLPGVVMHEVIHAYNEHALRWAEDGLSWFDEGTAKYVEYLVKHEQGLKQPELFGDETTWTGPCKDQSGRCRYTLPPRGSAAQLWEYYQQDSDMMYRWSPDTAATPAERTFGYAFAELFVRDYIRENGVDALHPVYEDLLERQASTTERVGNREATDWLLETMDMTLEPCNADTRDVFEQCLDAVNTMDPEVPSSVTVRNTTTSIQIDQIEAPEPATGDVLDQLRSGNRTRTGDAVVGVVNQILYGIGRLVTGIMNNVFK